MKEESVSTIADEASDVGHQEKIDVFLQYIPRGEGLPVKGLWLFSVSIKTNAEYIFIEIETVMKSMCFDSASTMVGEMMTGIQARCKRLKRMNLA